MDQNSEEMIGQIFHSLSADAKAAIISNGAALYLSSLKKRLFLAHAKIREFEVKYKTTLDRLDENGLPDNADMQMHEDYIVWHHWQDKNYKLTKQIDLIMPIVEKGIHFTEVFDACD